MLIGRDVQSRLKLDWSSRRNICLGIAKGLAYLHEESILKIVHRDIKASNVLLDKDLNAKISDFGLAKLDEEDKTHISTRVAGTMWVIFIYSFQVSISQGVPFVTRGLHARGKLFWFSMQSTLPSFDATLPPFGEGVHSSVIWCDTSPMCRKNWIENPQ